MLLPLFIHNEEVGEGDPNMIVSNCTALLFAFLSEAVGSAPPHSVHCAYKVFKPINVGIRMGTAKDSMLWARTFAL